MWLGQRAYIEILDEREMDRVEAIIRSMTTAERGPERSSIPSPWPTSHATTSQFPVASCSRGTYIWRGDRKSVV